MLARKLRRGRKEYGVEDEAGNTLIEPSATTKGAARVAAARLAAGRGESVYVFEVGEDSDGREEIRPPVEPPKSKAQIKREIDEILARKPGSVLGGGLARNVSADSRVVVFGKPGSPPLYVSPWMTKAKADREVRRHRAMNKKRGHEDYEVVLEPRWMVEEREEYARRHNAKS